MRARVSCTFSRTRRWCWQLALSALATVGAGAADQPGTTGATPLLDYAQEQTLPTLPFSDSLWKRLTRITSELERHPPPATSECAHTLGASRFASLYDDLGAVRSNLGDSEGAVEAFEKALACTPRAAPVHAALAAELLSLGRLDEARAVAERGLAVDRDESSLEVVLSRIDFIQERWAEAAARFRTAATVEPDDERATYWQCFLWLAQRRAGSLHPALASRVEYDEWPAPILDVLKGTIPEEELLPLIRSEESERRRREMLAEALYYLGEMRLANGNTELARRYFAAAVNLKVLYFIEHHMALAEIAKLRAAREADSASDAPGASGQEPQAMRRAGKVTVQY